MLQTLLELLYYTKQWSMDHMEQVWSLFWCIYSIGEYLRILFSYLEPSYIKLASIYIILVAWIITPGLFMRLFF